MAGDYVRSAPDGWAALSHLIWGRLRVVAPTRVNALVFQRAVLTWTKLEKGYEFELLIAVNWDVFELTFVVWVQYDSRLYNTVSCMAANGCQFLDSCLLGENIPPKTQLQGFSSFSWQICSIVSTLVGKMALDLFLEHGDALFAHQTYTLFEPILVTVA